MRNKILNIKLINRFTPILFNGLKSVLSPVLSLVFSYLIINYFSKTLWGEFVHYLLFFYLATILVNWGSKMYLLRGISNKPKDLVAIFQEYFFTRIPILILAIITILVTFESKEWAYLTLWILSAYIYNSFIPIILYFRDFGKQIFIELASFFLLILLINYYRHNLNLFNLLKCYSIYLSFKSLIVLVVYFRFIGIKSFQFNFKLLLIGFPFLLLAISGFLQSKIDLYTFAFYTNDRTLGEYQIISGFFIFSQSIATIIVLPYIKNIYRMSIKSILKFKYRLSLYGIFLNTILILFINYLLILFFDINLSLIQLLLGYIISYPCYIYTIDIFILFKTNNEKKVVLISALSMSINFFSAFMLLNFYPETTSALLANAIAQIFSLIYYFKLRGYKSISIN